MHIILYVPSAICYNIYRLLCNTVNSFLCLQVEIGAEDLTLTFY